MKIKVITVIFKNGETATFENCLDVYEMRGEWLVYFKGESVKVMHITYSSSDVACVVNGYVEKVEDEA